MTGAFAEFERNMIQARIHAGLKRAVAAGKTLGRPLNNPDAIEKAKLALRKGIGINARPSSSDLATPRLRGSRLS